MQNSEFAKRPAKQLGVLRTFSLEVMQIFKNFKGNKSRLATFPKEKRVFGFKFEVRKTASPERAAHSGNLPHIFKGKRQRLAISRTEKQKKMQERGRHTPSSGIQLYEAFLKQRIFLKLQKVLRPKSPPPYKIWGSRISGNVFETCEKCIVPGSRVLV